MNQFIFEYDLNLDMNPASGQLIFTADGIIRAEENGAEIFSLPAKEIKEAKVQAGVGCGLIFVQSETAPHPNEGVKGRAPCGGSGAGRGAKPAPLLAHAAGAEPPRTSEATNDRVLCRFSMTGLKQAGEFCKIVNFYIESGEATFPDEPEKLVCEQCGRPMISEISVCVFCYNKFSVMKRAMGFLRPYWKTVTFSQILNVISQVAFLIPPIIIQQLIDTHLQPENTFGTWGQIGVFAGALVLSRIFGEGLIVIAARRYNHATISVFADMRASAYRKLQSHSMSLFAKRTPGDLIRRIMEDTDTVGNFLTDLARWAVEMVLLFVIASVILLIADWRLALLVLLPVPFVAVIMWVFQRFLHSRFERQWRKSSRVNSILHDIIKGIRTVKSFGNEKREIEKYAQANHDLASISSENEVLWACMFPPLTFLVGVGEFLVLFVGGWLVLRGDPPLPLGVFVMFSMYLWAIYEPLRWLVNMPRWMAETTTSMVKVFELLDEESEIKEAAKPKNVPISGKVAYNNVFFGYKSYEPVLKGINLEIQPGEMIGLVGKSGVGKSTLINLAMRLYDPNNGRVTINDTDLRAMTPSHLHENTGVVFQDSFLFAGTFFDNIAYGKNGATLDDVISAAKAANAHDFITQTPDGYMTLIGEGGQSLSGGERQRLAIARAIIKAPDILILDEATSSLDVETESVIQDSLARITKNRTTIAIAHRLSTLRNADRLVVLDKGGVAEVGTHVELLRKKGIYFDLVMAQRKSSRDGE